MKKMIKNILPDSWIRFLTGFFYGWHGNFSTWEKAEKRSSGYDSELIFVKVKDAALKVKTGKAKWERDSVLFYKPEYSVRLVDAVNNIYSEKKSSINILDFGGSLGSTFFQNKEIIEDKIRLWCIVEQEGLVKEGKVNFETEILHFFSSIEEAMSFCHIDLVILSSVLQYLKEPYAILGKILQSKPDGIFIDRTPFIAGKDRITVQKVHPKIYKAQYPCWFFNEEKFRKFLIHDHNYHIVFSFDALDKANIRSQFKGFFLKHK